MRIPQLPRALWWDHNAYYHRWLLRQLPARVDSALDVGCGAGALASALAERADRVDGVDRSALMIERARRRTPRVNWVHGDLLDDTLPLDQDGYGLVTAVSSMHHIPLRPALRRLAGLVRPGGVLAVIGLYRKATLADWAMEPVSLPANAGMGALLAARGMGGKAYTEGMPMLEPLDTLPEIKAAADEVVPGAVLRRRVFWRYSLLWRRLL
ncbi:MAG TPA: class I SAM-dependent methyltransferase [Pseudonocardiaceae bacterium]|nr:class I SAM-dependent methyltransferase [Pseudonocardiaceae bacterium]